MSKIEFMAAQDSKRKLIEEEKKLPKEPLDLPKSKAQTSKQEERKDNLAHYKNAVKTLIEWKAPGRPFRKRGKQYYLTSALIVLLIEAILFLFSQYMLMLLVLSLLFVSFALATVPPRDFKYRISSEGVVIEDHFFLWQELYDFYFKKREGVEVLHVRTRSFIPGEITLTLGNEDRERVKFALIRYLPYREVVKQTFMEKSGDWLAKNFPLEKAK